MNQGLARAREALILLGLRDVALYSGSFDDFSGHGLAWDFFTETRSRPAGFRRNCVDEEGERG